jgi:ribosomal protein L37AE/L43A
VGKLFFRNMDDEWEQFPTDEQLQAARESAHHLQELGFAIICQLCNTPPTVQQIKQRALQNDWKCDKCGTVNSAGKA